MSHELKDTQSLRERYAPLIKQLLAIQSYLEADCVGEAAEAIPALLDRCIALEEALTRCADFLETAPLESGVCCCGSPVEGHGFGDGHSPVDELQYHASNLAQDVRALLGAA